MYVVSLTKKFTILSTVVCFSTQFQICYMLCLQAKCDRMLSRATNGHVAVQHKPILMPFIAQFTEFTGTVKRLR